MQYVLYGLIALIVAFLAVILIRTAAFKPRKNVELLENEESFDKEKAVESLRELVKCKTVSSYTRELEDDAEFEKLISKLPKLYPNVNEKCPLTKMEDRGLLFKWEGKAHDAPAVMMAHYDVVPVNEDMWEKPPFEAILEDGVLWGRGTLDTKVTFNAILSAADKLIAEGFVPDNDVYFAFSGGEEVNGEGAIRIVDWFEKNGITPALVVDEGGAVVEGVFPGVSAPCGLIGIAEKGMMDVCYKTKSGGGHASAPKPHTPVGILSAVCCRVENKPFKMHLTKPVAEMFDTLGRHSSLLYRMIFANLWCFSWVLDLLCKKSGGELNALMRTTVAFTQMSGSKASNVIPPEASMVSNMRLNPKDNIDSALDYIKKAASDPNVEITCIHGMNPSPISETGCDAWDKVAKAVASTWKGCIVSPYLMVQCSDSRHYGRISNHVYRFSAMDLTSEERSTIHGNNERIRLETVYRAVEFYIRLMRQC
ncbi:MAG: M20/M25/M40 family metallo-hydrolase [Oscillospiraceae bacterium]|nr:M20/M25/M40 family metallo-hydrolase [Oscillospiraceae bacterium]MBQ9938974.1 M20/M25/M40 family metallo-hydrolase [Oscillospiraceae bacterium]